MFLPALCRYARWCADTGLSEQSDAECAARFECARPMKAVPQALSGYRPRVTFNGIGGLAIYWILTDALGDACGNLHAAVRAT